MCVISIFVGGKLPTGTFVTWPRPPGREVSEGHWKVSLYKSSLAIFIHVLLYIN